MKGRRLGHHAMPPLGPLVICHVCSAESAVSSLERPLCTCGVHTACSRSRISVYNDTERTALYVKALSKVCHVCVCVCVRMCVHACMCMCTYTLSLSLPL